jgi:hypothetical protein
LRLHKNQIIRCRIVQGVVANCKAEATKRRRIGDPRTAEEHEPLAGKRQNLPFKEKVGAIAGGDQE